MSGQNKSLNYSSSPDLLEFHRKVQIGGSNLGRQCGPRWWPGLASQRICLFSLVVISWEVGMPTFGDTASNQSRIVQSTTWKILSEVFDLGILSWRDQSQAAIRKTMSAHAGQWRKAGLNPLSRPDTLSSSRNLWHGNLLEPWGYFIVVAMSIRCWLHSLFFGPLRPKSLHN